MYTISLFLYMHNTLRLKYIHFQTPKCVLLLHYMHTCDVRIHWPLTVHHYAFARTPHKHHTSHTCTSTYAPPLTQYTHIHVRAYTLQIIIDRRDDLTGTYTQHMYMCVSVVCSWCLYLYDEYVRRERTTSECMCMLLLCWWWVKVRLS